MLVLQHIPVVAAVAACAAALPRHSRPHPAAAETRASPPDPPRLRFPASKLPDVPADRDGSGWASADHRPNCWSILILRGCLLHFRPMGQRDAALLRIAPAPCQGVGVAVGCTDPPLLRLLLLLLLHRGFCLEWRNLGFRSPSALRRANRSLVLIGPKSTLDRRLFSARHQRAPLLHYRHLQECRK